MSIVAAGGPMFESADQTIWQSVHRKDGAHYNIFGVANTGDRGELGMAGLRSIFPEGKANDLNFVLFSTSGVHGSYITIEEIEEGLKKYGDDPKFADDWPDDYCGDRLTFLIVHPRLVCLRYGQAKVTLADIPYLKELRQSSIDAVRTIGTEAVV